MQANKKELDWFNSKIRPHLVQGFSLTEINDTGGDLGDLLGFQFDSDETGGYIYFWSFGFVSFQLVDYIKGVELVCDSTREVGLDSYDNILKEMVLKIQ